MQLFEALIQTGLCETGQQALSLSTSVSLSKSMMSRLSVSSGMVPSTKVTVEMTTTDIEVKANI